MTSCDFSQSHHLSVQSALLFHKFSRRRSVICFYSSCGLLAKRPAKPSNRRPSKCLPHRVYTLRHGHAKTVVIAVLRAVVGLLVCCFGDCARCCHGDQFKICFTTAKKNYSKQLIFETDLYFRDRTLEISVLKNPCF